MLIVSVLAYFCRIGNEFWWVEALACTCAISGTHWMWMWRGQKMCLCTKDYCIWLMILLINQRLKSGLYRLDHWLLHIWLANRCFQCWRFSWSLSASLLFLVIFCGWCSVIVITDLVYLFLIKFRNWIWIRPNVLNKNVYYVTFKVVSIVLRSPSRGIMCSMTLIMFALE